MIFTRSLLLIPAFHCILFPALTHGSDFDLPEPTTVASPDSATRLEIPLGEKVLDLDVSPLGRDVAVLLGIKGGPQKIMLWELGSATAEKIWSAPAGFKAQSLAWHPARKSLFLLGRQGKSSLLFVLDNAKADGKARLIHRTPQMMRRLVVGPRPFITSDRGDTVEYRVFFGVRDSSGGFSIRSVTENGRKPYQVIGKASGITPNPDGPFPPSELVSPSALPIGFHPAGHMLIWEDAKSCFETATYGSNVWYSKQPILDGKVCAGTVTASPNGLALLHWRPGVAGLDILMLAGRSRNRQAQGYEFLFTPSSVPDGKGVVGVIEKGGRQSLVFAPLQVPLADVVNAWMFVETERDIVQLAGNGSVLRNTGFEQMYNLYETENYNCGDFDRTTPTRPYFVTTDAFWEVFAAAYEGLFVVTETRTAIPAFWKFIASASVHFRTHAPSSHWSKVFSSLDAVRRGIRDEQGEAARIQAAQGRHFSAVLGESVDYGALKPRGHYASSPEFQTYFKAFTYLTRLAYSDKAPMKELGQLPPGLKQKAMAWINPYLLFIAGSRSPLAWVPTAFRKPAYNKHPESHPKLFPLSWAMDNEILNSTVYHEKWPKEDQIQGPKGRRLIASALDIPAALGNPLALQLMTGDLARYPNLQMVLSDLRKRPWPKEGDSLNLYDQWLRALDVQWSAMPPVPGKASDWKSWDAKRLQTGLASWATLRHATVLVNESSAAECGEGGYEEIVLRPPRGYVEPDPRTFSAIAGLFDAAAFKLRRHPALIGPDGTGDTTGMEALRKGLLNRLAESAATARLFATMAEKELRGVALADSEYDAILSIGRLAEHHFLVYKSLSKKGLGLAVPDPIPKIAEIAHGPRGSPHLFAAVGHPMEWDQVVPFFGRRAIVKGAAYSFYEFASDSLFNDKEWQARLSRQDRPAWIKPYVSDKTLACPPQKPY